MIQSLFQRLEKAEKVDEIIGLIATFDLNSLYHPDVLQQLQVVLIRVSGLVAIEKATLYRERERITTEIERLKQQRLSEAPPKSRIADVQAQVYLETEVLQVKLARIEARLDELRQYEKFVDRTQRAAALLLKLPPDSTEGGGY